MSGDINTSSKKEEEGKSEHSSGKSEKSLCSIPGCDFIFYGVDEAHKQDHFLTSHRDSELTENSFIVINSAMAEAMEIIQEIQEIKEENN